MVSDAQGLRKLQASQLEFYDFPGKYNEEVRRRASMRRSDSRPSRRLTAGRYGDGDAVSLFPGGLTNLEEALAGFAEHRVPDCAVRDIPSTLQYYRSGGDGGPAQ